MPTAYKDIVRARLGSPSTTEISDAIMVRDCVQKALNLYSQYRPRKVYEDDFEQATAGTFEYDLPADCYKVLSVFICDNNSYTETELRSYLRELEGSDDTNYMNSDGDECFWSQDGKTLVLTAPADAGADINLYYEAYHTLDGDGVCVTARDQDIERILEGAEGYGRLIHAGYAGRLVQGGASEDREALKKQGQEQVDNFTKWAKTGYIR